MKGTATPWGRSDHSKRYARGITYLSTPRHGGIRVSEVLARKRIPPMILTKLAIPFGGAYWFEEDCAFTAVVLCFPEYFQDQLLLAARTFNFWYRNAERPEDRFPDSVMVPILTRLDHHATLWEVSRKAKLEAARTRRGNS